MLTLEGCRQRQQRLLARLDAANLDAALVYEPRDIYYLTGLLPENRTYSFPSLLFFSADRSWLITWKEGEAAVDQVITYEPHTLSTINPDNMSRLAAMVMEKARQHQGLGTVGYQWESLPATLRDAFQHGATPRAWDSIDGLLQEEQLRKDPDEIDCIRRAIAAVEAGYARASTVIRPGVLELDVFLACHAAALAHSRAVHYYGGEFRSGEFAGPARDRPIEAGELYIIDAQADVDGYWSDMARTWSVSGQPTELQQSVYDHLVGILAAVPAMIQIGRSTTDFWRELDARIREHPHLADVGLTHHGGHGVGLRAHEGPDVNRDRGGFFEAGNVLSIEPGAYTPALRAGVRVEEMFLVTEQGTVRLSQAPFCFIPSAA